MEEPAFLIRFDGASADQHEIDMRQLGESLIGVERLITTGLFVMDAGRLPKRNERLPLLVRAKELQQGSVDIPALLGGAGAFLPLFHELYITSAAHIIWRWMSGALLKMGGREREAETHFTELFRLLDKVDARRHIEVLEWQKLSAPARRVVTPVGHSCDRLLLEMDGDTAEIDLPVAEAIRSRDNLEVGDMESFRIKIDGFTHHNKQLKIAHLSEPGKFITGHVRDPVFQADHNIYTDAAIKQGWLNVTAKPVRKEGRIQALYIMDATEAERE